MFGCIGTEGCDSGGETCQRDASDLKTGACREELRFYCHAKSAVPAQCFDTTSHSNEGPEAIEVGLVLVKLAEEELENNQ